MNFTKHESKLDHSVNFVADIDEKQKVECRYVKRDSSDYFIVYISSQTGCRQACRMCHLTSTGQNIASDVSVEDMLKQADVVLDYFVRLHEDKKWLVKPKRVHFNFMARGEPLACRPLVNNAAKLFEGLREKAERLGLDYEFLISTIIPEDFAGSRGLNALVESFEGIDAKLPKIYYSLYSMDPAVRKKWLPRAADPRVALNMIRRYLEAGGSAKVHFAFIDGVNDTPESVDEITKSMKSIGVDCDFNIVRYNPYDGRYGKETSEDNIEALKDRIVTTMSNDVKVVPKVGFDVKASCGMFVK